MITNLRVHSTFKRSDALNEMIAKNLKRASQITDRITYTRIYLRKKKESSERAKVIIQMGLANQQVVVSQNGNKFETSFKAAFDTLKKQLQAFKTSEE